MGHRLQTGGVPAIPAHCRQSRACAMPPPAGRFAAMTRARRRCRCRAAAAPLDPQCGQDFPRRPRGRRRLARGPARRGPCADRRERRRQVDADAPRRRRLPARQRHHRARRRVDRRPQRAGRRRRRHRHGVPGAQPRRRAQRRRQHLCRPPADQPPRRHPPRADARGRQAHPRRPRGRHRSPHAGVAAFARPAADGRDRQGAVARAQAAHPRRADLVADAHREPPPVSRHPPARRPGRGDHLRLAPDVGDLRDIGSGDGAEGRARHRRLRHRGEHPREPDRHDGRPGALLRARPASRRRRRQGRARGPRPFGRPGRLRLVLAPLRRDRLPRRLARRRPHRGLRGDLRRPADHRRHASASTGRSSSRAAPSDSMAAGISMLPEDRKEGGLFIDFSVVDNVVAANLQAYTHGGLLSRPEMREGRRRLRRDAAHRDAEHPPRGPQPFRRQPAEGAARQVAGAQARASSSSTSRPAASMSAPRPTSTASSASSPPRAWRCSSCRPTCSRCSPSRTASS